MPCAPGFRGASPSSVCSAVAHIFAKDALEDFRTSGEPGLSGPSGDASDPAFLTQRGQAPDDPVALANLLVGCATFGLAGAPICGAAEERRLFRAPNRCCSPDGQPDQGDVSP
ncbi:hypothetical protein BN10_640023 [Phycicoccus elongatus Lp2]|uniref:Uncharacterized protein n=1 Tax=Phycicoccus elongatus Lp2 TaxID=1193181 RepID=N0E185_9MICO|nr:hypothetical protein BN10_640023 [Phycicoccus elongatus Lp2]